MKLEYIEKSGLIKNEKDEVLWAISVYNDDHNDDPINLFAFFPLEHYPEKSEVRQLMENQYGDWVEWVDNGGYQAETVCVE